MDSPLENGIMDMMMWKVVLQHQTPYIVPHKHHTMARFNIVPKNPLTPHRALAINVDLDLEVFKDLDPPARRGAFEVDNPCILNGRAGCQPSTDAQEQQSELAAGILPQTSTHQPWDFSESGLAATIHEADPPAEHDANVPALPPSPMVELQSAMGLIDVPKNPYGSDLEAPAPHDDTESDQDEEASLEDEFCPVSDNGGEDEDMEHGQGASMSGAGIGPVPFMQMLQSFHYKHFDNLHLQYLELMHNHCKNCPKQFWVHKQAFGSFSDQNGYAGFVPSAGYLCRFYDMIIEQQSTEMKQCIAMLPLSRVGSAPLFTALHTVVNEYSEIWSMLFTMTKGHDQYMPNLCEISKSLVKFEHPEVQAVFTDNICADKNELDIMVAFDMEWLVNLETGIYSPVALIQVAYQNTVYLIKTAPFLENGVIKLPQSLLVFLHSLLFKKVGHVELGAMAKECGATVKRTVGLAKLIRILLSRHLPKDPQVHVSPWWADAVLPQEYINYAVLNVYAVSQVHLQLTGMDIAEPVVATTPSGTAIALLAPDGQEVAYGIVALEHPPALDETLGDHQDPEFKVLNAGYIDSSSPLMSTLVLNEDECDGDFKTSPEQTIKGSLWLFAQALSAAFFTPVMEDKAAMEALLSKPEWVLSHIWHHGNMNRTGKAYIRHFNVLLKNHISRLLTLIMDALVSESSDFRCGWVNGNDYKLTHKTFSMIQFLPAFFKPLGMLEFNEVFTHKQNIQHKFIAESQGTLMAILPVHTCKERDLFQLLVQSSPLFLDSNQQPNWTALTVVCAGHANGHNIFYKLPEHLKTYYKTWTDFCNEQNTILLNTEIGKLLADHALQRSAVHYLYADRSSHEHKWKADNNPTTTGSSDGVNGSGKPMNKP
ncbi:hypothetical protein BDR06DRAFT_969438 [Suillus hirtellus]|nr:hypothetical protein BDR06DRAFT_969438 [Suillus hirtellus]